MTLLDVRYTKDDSPETEVLFREARRRRRRRWFLSGIMIIALAAAVVIAVITIGSSTPASRPNRTAPTPTKALPGSLGGGIHPIQPGPLAVGPNGTLYVADEGREQILASPLGRDGLPSGRFQVIAGDGRAGFSGDGGPANDAEISGPRGMAVSSDGTIYFADRGNNRIRAVLPNGTITTVAGNGQMPTQYPESGAPPVTGVPATQVAIGQPTSVTIGPGGALYLATENWVLKIGTGGLLSAVDDGAMFDAADPGVMYQEECYPAAIAFDASAGNLYINCSSPWVMLVQAPDGSLRYLGANRPHDAWANIAAAPGGGVFAADGESVVSYGTGPNIDRPSYGFQLYQLPGGGHFWPQGVAAAEASFYTDADGTSGIGPPAIVAGAPPGPVTVLWDQSYRDWIHSMEQQSKSG
jgi:hypothetical protein